MLEVCLGWITATAALLYGVVQCYCKGTDSTVQYVPVPYGTNEPVLVPVDVITVLVLVRTV